MVRVGSDGVSASGRNASVDMSESTPILGSAKERHKSTVLTRFQSKSCIVLVGLVILVAVVSLVIVYSPNAPNDEIPDPEFALPPSSMPMGLYSNVGVVSNGGPCAQIGV
ncbi:PREDICTED: uncharacterized protein LOC107172305 [Diuraphis noxia]|uniref:uncharacterized protein LOC107172305 n=1 Tax=Diuraphis noxia TaxID=143948 RepID=UPI0007637FEB|nr:PREDICTED: uncharacterized protein LOC107172305 [Diuraphis noxia]